MTFKPVDTAITMVVGPCIDDTDFKSLEEAIAYNAAGMDVSLIVEKTDGTTAVTAITLTTGGTSDWTHKDGGYYEVEVTAAQNAEEGIAYLRGVCTGVLPFESAHYNIVKANIYDSLIKGTDVLQVDLTQIGGVAQSATDLQDFADAGYDPATNKITGTADMRGTDSATLAAIWTDARAGYLDNLSAGAVALASGVDLTKIHGVALTETVNGYLAAAFTKLLDVATPLLVASDVMRGTDSAALAATALTDVTWTDARAGYLDELAAANLPTDVANIEADTQDLQSQIGTAGAGLSDLGGMSTGMKAEVQTEANDALVAQKLDHLIAVADTDDAVNDSIIAKLAASDGDWSGFDKATDSLEAIRDRGDAAWVTGAGGSDRLLMVDTTIATLASQTSFTLTAGSTDDDAYNNCTIVIEDSATATQKAMGIVSNYTGATKTVTLKYNPAVFTMAGGDKVYILAENALKATLANRQLNVAADGDIAGFEDVKTLLKSSGNIFYVSKDGDNSDGTTWAKAKTTLDAAIALCTANNGDQIYIAPGTYDETANGASGVICDVAGIWIKGVLPGVLIKNTNTTNAGKVFTITATDTLISDIAVDKGEVTSDNAIMIDVNGTDVVADIRNTTVTVEKSTHTGIRFTGGALSCSYMNGDLHLAHIYSINGVGTGIELGDCVGCVIIDPQIHDVTTGMKFTGGASCHHNTVSADTVIVSCDTGIQIDAGAESNILSALILNCTTEYVDNSGNETNKTEGSLTYVLSDIRAALVEAMPQTHLATSDSTVTYGSVASGTYADTNTENDTYWQINPDAVNAIDMYSQFTIGEGRTPSIVDFNGRFQGHIARYCEVDAWNYSTSAWETISSNGNRIGHATSDFDRQWSLTSEHVKAANGGEMKIRIHSTSTTIADNLYIDMLVVTSVAQAAGGLTADAVTTAVWNRHVSTIIGEETMGARLRDIGAFAIHTGTAQAGADVSITLGADADANDGVYNRNLIVITAGTGIGQTRTIVDYNGTSKVATIDRDWRVNPDVTSEYQITPSDTPLVVDHGVAQEGTATTIKLRAYASSINDTYLCNIVTIIAGAGRGQARLVGAYNGTTKVATICGDNWVTTPDATSIYVMMPYGVACVACASDNALTQIREEIEGAGTKLTLVKDKTDNLPSGIAKNVALSNFELYMVLSADHVTAATGKTVAGTVSKDGAAFASLTNAISEIGNGMYKVDLTQAEMNADVVTLKFTATNCDQRIITIYTS